VPHPQTAPVLHSNAPLAQILVLLEGVDATTSSTVQARQSYTVDDICWDATFVPCARRQPSGGVRIDFDLLHKVLPLGHMLPRTRAMRMPTIDLPITASLAASMSSSADASMGGRSLLDSGLVQFDPSSCQRLAMSASHQRPSSQPSTDSVLNSAELSAQVVMAPGARPPGPVN